MADSSLPAARAVIDAGLAEFFAACRRDLSVPCRALYLAGSYAEGVALPRSDLDLILVVDGPFGPAATVALTALRARTGATLGIPIDCLVLEESKLADGVPAYARQATLLFGSPSLAGAPACSPATIASRWASGSLRLMQKLRGGRAPTVPASLPDPTAALGGYQLPAGPDGVRSAKLVVNLVARIAGALLAHRLGIEAPSKRESLRLFALHFPPPSGEFVGTVADLLLVRCRYGIPTDGPALDEIEALLRRLPAFEQELLESGIPGSDPTALHEGPATTSGPGP